MKSDQEQQQQQQQQQQGQRQGQRLCPLISTASSITGKTLGGFANAMVKDPSAWCFHGSTVADFARADYRKVIDEFFVFMNSCPSSEVESSRKIFDDSHKEIIVQSKFVTFLFALVTSTYLQLNKTKKDSMNNTNTPAATRAFQRDLQELLQLGIRSTYILGPHLLGKEIDIEQTFKYIRDVHSDDNDRGIINCLYRETKQHCTCMKAKKAKAKEMIKMECCNGCRQNFPKPTMKKCEGCNLVVYCSTACYKKEWKEHKDICEKFQKHHLKKLPGVAASKK